MKTVFRDALELGLSQPWPIVLYNLGGSPTLDAGPIIEYFKPLMDYIKETLKEEEIGWEGQLLLYRWMVECSVGSMDYKIKLIHGEGRFIFKIGGFLKFIVPKLICYRR